VAASVWPLLLCVVSLRALITCRASGKSAACASVATALNSRRSIRPCPASSWQKGVRLRELGLRVLMQCGLIVADLQQVIAAFFPRDDMGRLILAMQ
jgi:hypothetical protein